MAGSYGSSSKTIKLGGKPGRPGDPLRRIAPQLPQPPQPPKMPTPPKAKPVGQRQPRPKTGSDHQA